MKFRFPSPYSVLMLVIVFAAGLTWLLPAGHYDTLSYDAGLDLFQIEMVDGSRTMPATQETLTELAIPADLEKFTSGAIQKPVSIPDTFQEVDASPQGLMAIFVAPVKGIYEVIDIILLVLMIGGFIGVFNHSGVLDEGVAFLAGRLKGREGLLIILVTSLIAIGGTTFGMAEETLAFYPILVPVFLAAGYDLIVPLAVIFIAAHMGTMASTTNPFATIIASDAAGINWTVGLISRLGMLIAGTGACIAYIMRYGKKVQRDSTNSLLHGLNLPNPFSAVHIDHNVKSLPVKSVLLLSLFGGAFGVMIAGVAFRGWWLEEMTVVFLVASILMGFLQRTPERDFVREFMNGAKDLLGVCFIIGIARGVTIIMNDGRISDTILYNAVQMVDGMSGFIFLPVLMLIYMVLGIFISSTSGMAVVTMPIMSSLSQIIGVPVEEIVNAYQFGIGLVFFLSPTGLLLPSLAMVNVDYNTWFRFIWPLMLILFGVGTVILWLGLYF